MTSVAALVCPACGGVRTLPPVYFVATAIMIVTPLVLVIALVSWLRAAHRK